MSCPLSEINMTGKRRRKEWREDYEIQDWMEERW
jgi:hypothetical protein